MDLSKIFSKKRTNSEYLKYEDGDVITIEKVSSNPDKVPRLDINNTSNPTQDNSFGKSKPQSYEDNNIKDTDNKAKGIRLLKTVVVILLLISLLAYVVNLAMAFVIKTNMYTANTSTITDTNNDSNEVSNTISNTSTKPDATNTATNATNTTGTITNGKQEVVSQPIDYNEVQDLLQIITKSHGIIYNSYAQAKQSVINYTNNKIAVTILGSEVNRNYLALSNLYTTLNSKKTLFDKYNAQPIYLILLQRIENGLDLIGKLNTNTNQTVAVDTLNNHIIKENAFIDSQTKEFKTVLDKTGIKYTDKNGQLSWTIPTTK